MKCVFKFLSIGLLFIFAVITISCEIGLGPSVDTETPIIEILSPEADAIIRDQFAIRGTWSDDGDIGSATVSIKRTDKKQSGEHKFDISFTKPSNGESKGTWSAIINPFKANIIDGSYVATVSFSDKGGHTVIQDRSFIIDNHAPVIILQRPSSSKDPSTEIDSYGQNFTLVGQAADDCNISLIEVNIFSDPELTDLKATVPLKNVPNSINMDVANYKKDDTTNDYYKIYGDIPELTDKSKVFYFTIKAYDEAKRIPIDGSTPTAEDNKGNESVTYYLYEAISADPILSLFKITDLYHMKNGTFSLSSAEANREAVSKTVEQVVGKLADPALNIDTGRFSLNPENNPTFVISGKEINKNEDFNNTEKFVTNGSQLVIEVSAGLDGIALPSDADSITIFAVPYNAAATINDSEKIYPVVSRTKNGTGYKYIANINTSTAAKGTNRFAIGKNYVFGIEGADVKGNNFLPNHQAKDYGFHMASSGAAPKITITKPEGSLIYLKKGAKLEIEGSTSVDEGAPLVEVLFGDKVLVSHQFTEKEVVSVENSSYKHYNFAFTEAASSAIYDIFDQNETKNYTITVRSTNDTSSSENKSIIYDVETPKVVTPTVSPLVKEFDGHSNVINGTVTINGTISDNKQFDHAKYEIIQNGEVKVTDEIKYDYQFTLNTNDSSKFSDDTETKLIIYAYDTAGNEAKETFTYFIDQDSDKPAIGPNTASAWKAISEAGYRTPEEIRSQSGQTNKISAGSAIYVKLSDDDGLQQIKFSVTALDSNTKSAVVAKNPQPEYMAKSLGGNNTYAQETIEAGGVQETTISHKLPDTPGFYKVTVSATDTVGLVAAQELSTIILITGTNPEVTFTNNTDYVRSGNPISLKAVVKGMPPYRLSIYQNNSEKEETNKKEIILPESGNPTGDITDGTLTRDGSEYTYVFNYTPVDASTYIKLYVTDENEGNNTKQVDFKKDDTAPVITIANLTGKTGVNSINKDEKSNFRFHGKVTEANAISGVYVKILAEDAGAAAPTVPTAPAGKVTNAKTWTDAGWKSANTTQSEWNIYQNFKANGEEGDALAEGKYKVYVYGVDTAGNVSAIATKAFEVDMAAPESTFEGISSDFSKANVTLSGSVSETYGVESFTIKYTKDGEAQADIAMPAKAGAWTKEFSEDGLYAFTLEIKDKAGKTFTSSTKEITIDKTAPTAVFTSPAEADSGKWFNNGTIKFVVKVTDKNISTVEANYKTKNAEGNEVESDYQTFSKVPEKEDEYQGTLSLSDTGKDNPVTVNVKMTDKAGNVGNKAYSLFIDSVKPVINVTDNSHISSAEKTLKYMGSSGITVSGTASDAAPGSGDITVTIEQSHKSAAADAVYGTAETATVVVTNGAWSQKLPLTGSPEEGSYRFKLTVKDPAKNENSTVYYYTVVDKTAPVLKITNPIAASGNTFAVINNVYPKIEGTITETTALKNIYYKFVKGEYDATTDKYNYTAPVVSSAADLASWNKAQKTANSGTDKPWNFYQTFKVKEAAGEGLPEGGYKLYVYADDEAGNYNKTAESCEYRVDLAAPVVNITKALDYVNASTNPENARTVKFEGTITETNGIKSFEVKRGETPVAVTRNGNTWSCQDTPSADGEYVYTFIAEDLAGNKNLSTSKTVIVDTTLPTVKDDSKFIVPTAAQTEQKLFKFEGKEGSITDKGIDESAFSSGFAKIELDCSTVKTPASHTALITVLPNEKGEWSQTIEFSAYPDIFGTEEEPIQGIKYLSMNIYDKAGNASGWKTYLEFVYDTAIPQLIVNTPENNIVKTTSITLSGTAWDTYGLAAADDEGIKITAINSNGETKASANLTTSATKNDDSAKWSKDLTLPEGIYNINVTAKDKAGKDDGKNISIPLTVDTTAPRGTLELEKANGDYKDSNERIWFKSEQIKVKVTSITEETSGLESVKVKVFDSKDASPDSDWTVLTRKTSKEGDNTVIWYEGTVTAIAQGLNTIKAQITDKAGNTGNLVSKPVYIDTRKPETIKAFDAAKDGNEVISLISNAKTEAKTVYIEAADANVSSDATKPTSTGIKSISYDSTTVETQNKNGPYPITIPIAGKTGNIDIKITDNAGNEATLTAFKVESDTTPPVVKIDPSSLKDADSTKTGIYLNKKVQLKGSASDKNLDALVSLQYQTLDNSTWSAWTSITKDNVYLDKTATAKKADSLFTSDSTTYSWTTNWIDTEALLPASKTADVRVRFRVVVSDKAGNISSKLSDLTTDDNTNGAIGSEKTTVEKDSIFINQNTDIPIINFTNLGSETDSKGLIKFGNDKLYGNLSDDDGEITSIKYYYSPANAPDTEPQESDYIEAGVTGSNLSYTNGAFTLKFKHLVNNIEENDDGPHKLSFKIADSNGATYTSSITYLKVDTTEPFIGTVEFTTDTQSSTPVWSPKADISKKAFGGTRNKLIVKIPAWDINGISYVKLLIPVNAADKTNTFAKNTAGTFYEIPLSPTNESAGNASYPDAKYYKSAEIDVSTLATETSAKSCRIEASDGTMVNKDEFLLLIDNTAPTITFTAPTLDINSGEITVSGNSDEIGSFYYTVSTDGSNKPTSDSGKNISAWTGLVVAEDGSTSPTNGTMTSKAVPAYTLIPNTNLSWDVFFDANTSNTTRAHASYLKNFISDFGITNDLERFTNLVDLYIWIKAVDETGNAEEYSYKVTVDPQGDRPVVSLDYPENAGDSVGGTVKLYGSAEDPNGSIESVWVQILSAKNGTGYGPVKVTNNKITSFDLTEQDLNFWAENYTVQKIKPNLDSSGNVILVDGKPVHKEWSSLATDESPSDYAIRANYSSGASWNLKININEEFDPATGATSANDMAVRVYAVDNNTNKSYAVTRYIKMDKDTPVISNVYLKQYTGNTESASMEITSETFVKDVWYLTFTATDNVEMGEIKLVDKDGHEISIPDSEITRTNEKVWSVKHPLATGSGVGKLQYTIKASDKTNHNGTYEILVRYDNEVPKLLSDTTSADYNISPSVKQSSGFYKLASKVSDETTSTESPSGVKAVGFYFMRRKVADEGLIYDPLQQRVAPISTKDLTYENGLYWMSGSVTRDENNLGTITLSTGLAEKAAYIHAGSYITLGGVMYKIQTVSGTTITIDANPEAGYTLAKIALAMFVDNRKTESESGTDKNNGYYDNIKNDDGDHMIEELGGTSAVSSWQGNIVSRNIPDGPIEIHYTAFDNAMNYAMGIVGNKDKDTYLAYTTKEAEDAKKADSGKQSSGIYSSFVYTYNENEVAYISNNAPRLAGVTVAIDYTGSGEFSKATTISSYYRTGTILIDGKPETKPIDTTDSLVVSQEIKDEDGLVTGHKGLTRIKGKTWIVPEMVGGNGKLWYGYNVYSSDTNGNKITTTALTSSTDATYFADGTDDYDEYLKTSAGQTYVESHPSKKAGSSAGIAHEVSFFGTTKDASGKYTIPNSTIEQPTWFDYTIYDSTENEPTGNTTAFTNLANNKTATISIALAVDIHDETKPNVVIDKFHWNGKNDNSLYENKSSNGHIELEDELPAAFTEGGTGVNDRDPKVSGKINVTGYAYDNIRLGSLKLSVTDTAGTAIMQNSKLPNSTVVAIYDKAWFDSSTESKTGLTQGTIASDGWYFTVTSTGDDVFNGENGHKVKWTLSLDTEKITGVAAADIKVKVEAVDKAGLSSNEIYKMDVVPYITSIERGIKTGTDNHFNTYRARSGAYTLLRGEKSNIIHGFNIAYIPENNATSKKTGISIGSTAVTTFALSNSDLTFTVPATAKSSNLTLKVNGIESLNNINAYKAYNEEENVKAYDHNTITDDRYIHIWRVSSQDTFKGSKNAIYPAMSKADDGTLYASFTNYGQSKTYYTKSFTGDNEVKASSYNGCYYNYYNYYADPSIQTSGNNEGVATIFNGYDPPEETDIVVGSGNNPEVNVFYAANYHGGTDDSWNGTSAKNAGGIYIFDSHATSTYNSRTYHNFYRSELYTYDNELQQFKNIRVTRSGSYIYIAYYDRLRNTIKTSVINDSAAGNASQPDTSTYGLPWITLDGSDADDIDKNGTGFSFAGGWTPSILEDARYTAGGTTRASSTGESVAITTNKNGYPVVFYMDSDGHPRIAVANKAYPTASADWLVQEAFASSDENYDTASDYMACAVDSSGNLHIAFQNTKGQLVYAKSTNTLGNGAKYTMETSQVLDDSGMWIDMTLNGTTPYISYLSKINSFDGMKMAYYDPDFDENNDGAQASTKGGWETMTAPLNAKVTNVRSCIEVNAKAYDSTIYKAAIGFCPGSDYRAAFYVGE